jgi:GAF domain-containing protein
MPPAPLPRDELVRLDALERSGLLGPEKEAFFEQTVDAVQTEIAVPVVLVSLIDEDCQRFKARRGLEVDDTPRDVAFCAYAIHADTALVVADARLDPRFADNPLVNGPPEVIAYAGAPIKLECGSRIGTLCAIDHVPRNWSTREIICIEHHARRLAQFIDERNAAFIAGEGQAAQPDGI